MSKRELLPWRHWRHLWPQSRHRRYLLAFFVLVCALLGFLALGMARADSRVPAELAGTQWQRLTRQLTRVAERGRAAATGVPATGAGATATGAVTTGATGATATGAMTTGATTATAVPARAWPPPPLPCAESRPWLIGRDSLALAEQAGEYQAHRPKNILELQQFRRTYSARIADDSGREGLATLYNLNPRINSWYLLRLDWDGEPPISYHLGNARPETTALVLDPDYAGGLVMAGSLDRRRCELWSQEGPGSLAAAGAQLAPYVTLCEDTVVLRRPTAGHRTQLEWATDFLRDNVWVGEAITVLVRDNLYRDAHLVKGELIPAGADPGADPGADLGAEAALSAALAAGLPLAAQIDPRHTGALLVPGDFDLALASPQARLQVGAWYPTLDNRGVAVSVLRPGLVAGTLLGSLPRVGGRLDAVEAEALVYLVAFDLARFEAGFAVGTDHPRVSWSQRVRPDQRDEALLGPDGIGEISPLVAGGIVPFALAERTVATFTAGFKRSHGAFRSGVLGGRNSGSHYGFIESGVVLSKLQPGLATFFGLADGTLEMKTWSRDDDQMLERIAFARQNGVPIVETPVAGGAPVPGALVTRWADGNWSGSEDKRLRSVRAGICLQESAAGRFLLYGYFSSATPIAMARVFQAYGCSYAMITDMNALEHTYLALYRAVQYRASESRLEVDHLIADMALLDKTVDGQVLPRFLGFADNRDFFYIMRRVTDLPVPGAEPPSQVRQASLELEVENP